jgi:glucose/mannose-6-phosphate isomerase
MLEGDMLLDDQAYLDKQDPEDMLARIGELPRQCREAWSEAQLISPPSGYGDVRQLIIVGMGGSAIGGALLEGLVAAECPIPITVQRGYTLPAFVQGPDALVVGCSYSGNTEETLTAFGEALDRGARTLAITTNGKIADLAEESHTPVVKFGYESQPRAALGYSFVLLLGVIQQLGLLRDYTAELEEAVAVMDALQAKIGPDIPSDQNAAKQLASKIQGKLPVVYGAGLTAAVANRWKTQFNENAKHWAFFETLPELNHNAVVGFGIPEAISARSIVLMLRSSLDHPRVKKRWDVTAELLAREGVACEAIDGRGESALAQMLSLIHFGDYVSFYLAMLNEVDPTPVETIAFLKKRLAEAD